MQDRTRHRAAVAAVPLLTFTRPKNLQGALLQPVAVPAEHLAHQRVGAATAQAVARLRQVAPVEPRQPVVVPLRQAVRAEPRPLAVAQLRRAVREEHQPLVAAVRPRVVRAVLQQLAVAAQPCRAREGCQPHQVARRHRAVRAVSPLHPVDDRTTCQKDLVICL